MTCIVGVVENGEIYMGSDSLGVLNNSLVYSGAKVFALGDMLIGVTGERRAHQIVKTHLKLRSRMEGSDPLDYLIETFVPALREVLRKHGGVETFDGRERQDSMLLIGVKGRLFTIDGCFCVSEDDLPYRCIGSGSGEAQGAMYAMQSPQMYPEYSIYTALQASARFNDHVGGTNWIISTDNPVPITLDLSK